MHRDLRTTTFFEEAQALYVRLRQPGTGLLSDAAEVHCSPCGGYAVFSGTLVDELDGTPPSRVCRVDLETGDTRVLTFGPNRDRLSKYSPDGRQIAFLSDRHQTGNFQLYLLEPLSGAARRTPGVSGWVEYLHWSPDGRRILLGVAGHAAGISSAQGAIRRPEPNEGTPSWMPTIKAAEDSGAWRHLWVYELATGTVRQVSRSNINVWEGAWCGNDSVAAVVSTGPGEGLWYSARLHLIEIESGESHEMYAPKDQLGWPAASPSGRHLAFVEALCSDREIVAGDLRVLEIDSGRSLRVDTLGVDITCTEWRSDQTLLLAGHRGFETVVGLYDATSGVFCEKWSSRTITTGGRYATVSGLGESGDCVLVGEGFLRAPEIGVLRAREYRAVSSFDHAYADESRAIAAVDCITWRASDGIEIQGWLLRPNRKGPHPLVMDIHGGPVWHARPRWLGRSGLHLLLLVKKGYAVFFPNARGSGGRGQDFARRVLGDMGGADARDCLCGLDHLIAHEIADPKRLGVTGGSYGGYLTSWLTTQDVRFAAAVPVAPINNHVTHHLLSNIPEFSTLFLKDTYLNCAGPFFQRSPIIHAHKSKTPTLNICGGLDEGTPPEEARQFHSALLESGCKSVLVTYPEEGHGIRKLPAQIDYAARLVAWFEEHMGAASADEIQT